MKSAARYNKGANVKNPFKPSDKVMFKKNDNSFWYSGEVMENYKEPRSFVVRIMMVYYTEEMSKMQ